MTDNDVVVMKNLKEEKAGGGKKKMGEPLDHVEKK